MSSIDNLSPEDKEFLEKCEEEFKDRYTENDEEFMKVFKAEKSVPPIMKSWWVPNNSGRRNDRRNNRRYEPYNQNRRDHHSGRDHDSRGNYDRRGYNDYNRGYDNRGGGYRYRQ